MHLWKTMHFTSTHESGTLSTTFCANIEAGKYTQCTKYAWGYNNCKIINEMFIINIVGKCWYNKNN